MNCYIVVESSGEYSDFRTSNVKAFLDESKAEAMATELNAKNDALIAKRDECRKEMNKLWPNGWMYDQKTGKYLGHSNRTWDKNPNQEQIDANYKLYAADNDRIFGNSETMAADPSVSYSVDTLEIE